MGKYNGLTNKELVSRLLAAEKTIKTAANELAKCQTTKFHLAKTLKEVEPALEKASDDLAKLRTAMDELQKAKNAIEANFNQEIKECDSWREEAHKQNFNLEAYAKDMAYEKARRISAENKLFDLEKRLHNILTGEFPPSEVKLKMPELHIDRNGEIA